MASNMAENAVALAHSDTLPSRHGTKLTEAALVKKTLAKEKNDQTKHLCFQTFVIQIIIGIIEISGIICSRDSPGFGIFKIFSLAQDSCFAVAKPLIGFNSDYSPCQAKKAPTCFIKFIKDRIVRSREGHGGRPKNLRNIFLAFLRNLRLKVT